MIKIIMILMLLIASNTFCGELSESNLTINSILGSSESRPEYIIYEAIAIVYTNGGSWGNCSDGKAYIDKSDNHLLSIILTGWSIGKTFEIRVRDDEQKNGVCRMVTARMFD